MTLPPPLTRLQAYRHDSAFHQWAMTGCASTDAMRFATVRLHGSEWDRLPRDEVARGRLCLLAGSGVTMVGGVKLR